MAEHSCVCMIHKTYRCHKKKLKENCVSYRSEHVLQSASGLDIGL